MKASDIFVKALENEGVQYIFAVPGEENLDLLESIRQSNIELIVTRHEQAAGFMAATYGRLTEKAGVCLATLGPGATNLVTAAAYAQLGAMPMLMITGQKPIKHSKQSRFQIIDVVKMMGPLTKFTKQIVYGHTISALIREAFRLAQAERPGAVHLELPEDIAQESCSFTLFSDSIHDYPTASNNIIDKAAKMIASAQFPLLLIGADANRRTTCHVLEKFINQTGIHFFNTQLGKGVIDERNPLYLGTAALSEHDYIHAAIEHADLIINIGHDTIEKPPFIMKTDGAQVIHINFSPAWIDEIYFPQLEVIGDITHSIVELTRKLDHYKTQPYFENIKKELDQHIVQKSVSDQFPLLPQRLVADVRQAVPEEGIITLDNGMYKIWFARNYQAYHSNSILLDNALATMGAGLPSAIATKLVCPNKKVVAICGDGGFMMSAQELETAIRLKIDLVILILIDNSYGMIKWKQENMGFADFGLDFGNPDFVKFAESFGAHGHKFAKTKHFLPLLKKCLASPGINLIEVPIDYTDTQQDLGKKLAAKTHNL